MQVYRGLHVIDFMNIYWNSRASVRGRTVGEEHRSHCERFVFRYTSSVSSAEHGFAVRVHGVSKRLAGYRISAAGIPCRLVMPARNGGDKAPARTG
jgi:hypothetical protein